MGTWGYGPFDNDTAGDMIADIASAVSKTVDAKTDTEAQQHYQQARVAAAILASTFGTDILGGPDPEKAIRALARMRKDVEHLSSARNPMLYALAIEKQMSELLSALSRLIRHPHKRDALKDIEEIILDARRTEVPASSMFLRVRRKTRRTRGKVSKTSKKKKQKKAAKKKAPSKKKTRKASKPARRRAR